MKVLLVQRTRVVVDPRPQRDEFFPSIAFVGVDESLVDEVVHRIEEVLGFEVQRKPTLLAEVPMARDQFPAARAGDRGNLFGLLVGVDVDALDLCIRPLVGLVAEPGEVPDGVFRPALAALTVLDAGRLQPALDEPARVGLSEGRRCHVLRDTGPLGGGLEVVEPGVVRRPLGIRELRPEVSSVVAGGVFAHPVLQPGHRPDEVDGPLSFLPVDVEPDGVVAVEDVAHPEVVEFTPAETGLELDGDERLVSVVVTGVDHRFHVGLDEKIALTRRRVEVVARPGRDPRQTLRRLITLEPVAAERPQGSPVVLIRVFVVVLVVNPANDRVGGRPVVEHQPEQSVTLQKRFDVLLVGDSSGVGLVVLPEVADGRRLDELSHPRAVPEELEVPVSPNFRRQQADVIAHLEEVSTVGLVLDVSFAVFEPAAECIDLVAWVRVGHGNGQVSWIVKVQAQIRPLASFPNDTSEGVYSLRNRPGV